MNFQKIISSFLVIIFLVLSVVSPKTYASNDKVAEKTALQQEVEKIQTEVQTLTETMKNNETELLATQVKIKDTYSLIEQKKEDIIKLEDKVEQRKEILKERMISLQSNSATSTLVDVLVNSKNIVELIQRASTVSTLLNADKNIIESQQRDMDNIEEDKQLINDKEIQLEQEQKNLEQKQQELKTTKETSEASLQAAKGKYDEVSKQIAAEEAQKMAASLTSLQNSVDKVKAPTNTAPPVNRPSGISGREIYVQSTAYTPWESHPISASGIDLRQPGLKAIAVDPKIIPLGSRVYVEGYGEAIAADTGGAIKGYKIDVLMHSNSEMSSWGRRNVKVTILN